MIGGTAISTTSAALARLPELGMSVFDLPLDAGNDLVG